MQEDRFNIADPSVQRFYNDYAGIPSDQLEPHLEHVRSRLEEGGKSYKCIREYKFAYSRMAQRFFYPHILAIGRQSGENILIDIGCCAGADLRQLALDGYKADNLVGTDISAHFIECGYMLFQDSDRFPGKFLVGDIFSDRFLSFGDANAERETLNDYRGRAAIVYTGSVIHLLHSYRSIASFIRRVALLLRPGGLFVGAHVAADRNAVVYRSSRDTTKHFVAIQGFKTILEQAGFKDIDMRTETRVNDPDEDMVDFAAYWLSFCAVYRPEHTPSQVPPPSDVPSDISSDVA